jgi:uncharacterized protein DUF4430
MRPEPPGDGWISLPWATFSVHRLAAGVAAAAALACTVAVAACGFGAGPSSGGTATLTVTRDYGSKTLVEATDSEPPSSETVIRLLDSQADITTRYGGGFVQSIDGLAGTGSSDWFFYVNGVESPVGSADVQVKGGEKIWWDYRDWTAAMSVPAVVGSWPEPFAQASADHPKPVPVQCLGARPACEAVAHRLAAAGVKASVESGAQGDSPSGPRLLVGPWTLVRSDPAVGGLRGPQSTGVFATFKGPTHGGWHLIGLDQTGHPTRDLGPGAGLVAALGGSGDGPTWIVTGSGGSAVARAAEALDSDALRNHYAVAATGGGPVPLPIVPGGGE